MGARALKLIEVYAYGVRVQVTVIFRVMVMVCDRVRISY